jgi:anti-sigma regulatory factor (Ser/Thr protein kinase)
MHIQSLTVPATLDSLADIAALVLAAADTAGVAGSARYNLRLAVDELATNTISYGYQGMAPGTIDVRAEMDDKTLTVTIEDTGVPFDPRQAPPPSNLHLPPEQRDLGGLGIYLAMQGVDHFFYERVGGRNRNVLVVNRPTAPAANPPAGAPQRE